jgi:predicted O-methyltransferase YrrM
MTNLDGVRGVRPRETAKMLSRHMSMSGLHDAVCNVRFVTSREARAVGLRELEAADSPVRLLEAVNRHIPGGASQIAEEILGFIEFVRARQPKTLVEIGTEAGGTHLLLGRALTSLEHTIAVDLRVRNRQAVRGLQRAPVRFTAVDGDSSSPQTLEHVRSALGGRQIDVLFIDGDHSFRGAASDLLSYRPLVSPGGVIAFHDIVPDGWLRTGAATTAYAGEVPLIWERLRNDFVSTEFVASWNQEGKGIGVIEHDAEVAVRLLAEERISP